MSNGNNQSWDTLSGGRSFVRGIDSVLSDLKDAETGAQSKGRVRD
jgi:hypothetical protein